MDFLTLTQSNWFIIGPIAKLLGWVMNAIYELLNTLSIPSIGLSIILYTIIVKALMLPLNLKQQKFSKLNMVMNPEIMKIQKKYQNKKDNVSMMKQQEEIKEVYDKYGVSTASGCLPMLIQFPLIFALYQVIYKIPGYIQSVKGLFVPIQTALMNIEGWAANEQLIELGTKHAVRAADLTGPDAANRVIDLLYGLNHVEWSTFQNIFQNDGLTQAINTALPEIDKINNFFGINLATSPSAQMTSAWWVLLIPILAGLTQWLSTKMITARTPSNDDAPGMGMMNSMNTVMPIMSVFFCFTFSAGIGLYWVISSLAQMVSQYFVNRYMDRIDINDMVSKNMEKVNAKRAKQGLPPKKVKPVLSVKNLEEEEKIEEEREQKAAVRREEQLKQSTQYYNNTNKKKGSLASKAGMVQQYNEKNLKKK
ncbi:MAG: YidC/Oxa1 family membrane protein insertase [Clostridiales bacterium]|nr:YidC/Oxa1 family membrane protein insertase [Clostridiales bacterium]